jgi:hypothetical protein
MLRALREHCGLLVEECDRLQVALDDTEPGDLTPDLAARVDSEVLDLAQRLHLLADVVERACVQAIRRRPAAQPAARAKLPVELAVSRHLPRRRGDV